MMSDKRTGKNGYESNAYFLFGFREKVSISRLDFNSLICTILNLYVTQDRTQADLLSAYL